MSSTGTFSETSPSASCAAVYAFLTGRTEAGDLGTYATNPLFQIVDGPFRLSEYDRDRQRGDSGAEQGLLGPGQGLHRCARACSLHHRYRRVQRAGEWQGDQYRLRAATGHPVYKGKAFGPAGSPLGSNNSQLAGIYNLEPAYPWGSTTSPSTTPPTSGPIFKAAVRAPAMQSLMNQNLWIQLFQLRLRISHLRPVPVFPPTKLATRRELQPLPLRPGTREGAVDSHGWKVVPSGVTTCVKPAQQLASVERG